MTPKCDLTVTFFMPLKLPYESKVGIHAGGLKEAQPQESFGENLEHEILGRSLEILTGVNL